MSQADNACLDMIQGGEHEALRGQLSIVIDLDDTPGSKGSSFHYSQVVRYRLRAPISDGDKEMPAGMQDFRIEQIVRAPWWALSVLPASS